MNNQKNNTQQDRERRALPFFIEFVKFATGFAAIISAALLSLRIVSSTM